jgi:hypothetical protein
MGPGVVHGSRLDGGSPFTDNSLSSVVGQEKRAAPSAPRSGLPRRPCSAACGPGPSVFTILANRKATDRASVSQAVACRGAPPLPAMSLGACRCCLSKQNTRAEVGNFGRARPAGVPPPERSAGGGGHPDAPRFARRGSTGFRQIDPWNCSAGEDPLPEPFRTELPEGPRSEGPRVLLKRLQVTACESQNLP